MLQLPRTPLLLFAGAPGLTLVPRCAAGKKTAAAVATATPGGAAAAGTGRLARVKVELGRG